MELVVGVHPISSNHHPLADHTKSILHGHRSSARELNQLIKILFGRQQVNRIFSIIFWYLIYIIFIKYKTDVIYLNKMCKRESVDQGFSAADKLVRTLRADN